jgi:hypothetical protein
MGISRATLLRAPIPRPPASCQRPVIADKSPLLAISTRDYGKRVVDWVSPQADFIL